MMRMKRLEFSVTEFLAMCETGRTWQCVVGLPAGTEFYACALHPKRECMYVFIRHESFPILKLGEIPPLFEPLEFRRVS